MNQKPYVPWKQRLKYLGIPFGLLAFSAWVLGGLLWPLWFAVGTICAIVVITVYLALFVWPYDDMGDF